MDMLEDAPQPGLRQRAVPPRGPGPGPRPPGPQGEDQVEVEQPVKKRLLAGSVAPDLLGEQRDGGGMGRILVRLPTMTARGSVPSSAAATLPSRT